MFPLANLRIFSLHELKALICGLQDDSENWLPHGTNEFPEPVAWRVRVRGVGILTVAAYAFFGVGGWVQC